MNMITGCLAPTGGTILVEGHDIYEEQRQAKRHIGYLPEIPPLYLDMTPWEYLLFVCEIKGIEKQQRESAVTDAMNKTGVYSVKNRLIRLLSKGYRQRVGIAQAIIGYPEVIILDEPTVGLDPAQIIEIRELIRELGKEHTVLLSSHILSEVSELCQEVIIINRGKLVARDTPEGLAGRMSAGFRLSMTVEGSEQAVRDALMSTGRVSDIRVNCIGNGTVSVNAGMEEGAKDAVFYALAEARLPVHEMKTEKMSLEEIFLELTAGEKEGK